MNIAMIRTATPDLGAITGVIDGVTGLKYRYGASIADEPLEDGVQTQDHATVLPVVLIVNCIVGTLGGGQRPGAAVRALEAMWRAREPFRVTTEHTSYPEMLIRTFEPAQEGSVRGLKIRMELQEIRRIEVAELSAATVAGPASGRTDEVERGNVALGVKAGEGGATPARREPERDPELEAFVAEQEAEQETLRAQVAEAEARRAEARRRFLLELGREN